MKCPIDQTEMEAGITDGGWWRGKGMATGMQTMFGKNVFGSKYIIAYRCPKCGKVELTTEVNS